MAPHADQLALPIGVGHSYPLLYNLREIRHTLPPCGGAQEYRTPGQAEADTVRAVAMCTWVKLTQCAEYAIRTAARAPSARTHVHCGGSGALTRPGRHHAPTQPTPTRPMAHCWPTPGHTRPRPHHPPAPTTPSHCIDVPQNKCTARDRLDRVWTRTRPI